MIWTTVLELVGLRVEMRARPSYFDRWFDCRVIVEASPFGGTLETIFTDEQLLAFADAVDGLDPVGQAVLGGDRAPDLRLVVENQIGGRQGALAVECFLTPSGDDPYPRLRWLISELSRSPRRPVGGCERSDRPTPGPRPNGRRTPAPKAAQAALADGGAFFLLFFSLRRLASARSRSWFQALTAWGRVSRTACR
jgi:hypothetical protein